ncbi:MAG TPA: hypothetical protein VH437_07350 [Terriglobales bacterium]
MPARQLNDRIMDLCRKAIETPEGPELEKIARELRDALSEHIERIRQKALHPPPDRRHNDS